MDAIRKYLPCALALVLVSASSLAATPSSNERQEALREADATYRAAHKKCGVLPEDRKAACRAEALTARDKAKADAEAAFQAADGKLDAKAQAAKAEGSAARAKCDALSGDARDACRREARTDKESRVADAYKAAGDEMLEADFKTAMKRCESLAQGERESCSANVQARYGR